MSEVQIPENISKAILRKCASVTLPEDVAELRDFCEGLWRAGYWFSESVLEEQRIREKAEQLTETDESLDAARGMGND